MSHMGKIISVGLLETFNGYTLKGLTPDESGYYRLPLGCLGVPTRRNVWYDVESMVQSLVDPSSRINICLRDGNLFGEYGHPAIRTRDDIPRLLYIREDKHSHHIRRLEIDLEHPKENGIIPIIGEIKPHGPYGKYVEQSLRDPTINSSFSVRSLCSPMAGKNRTYEYRKVEMLITFDFVGAPGFDITSKRYASMVSTAPGNCSFDYEFDNVGFSDFVIDGHLPIGNESLQSLTLDELVKIYGTKTVKKSGVVVGQQIPGKKHIITDASEKRSVTSLFYDNW